MHHRQTEMATLVQQHGEIAVSELSKLLGVSEVTVRSDLNALVKSGQVRRTRGGARLPLAGWAESPLEQASLQHQQAKRRIGKAAAALIRDGETIFLDVGSTTTEVARAISPTVRHLTVATNSINIALELERLPHIQVIVTGGTLRPLQHSLVSPYALTLLQQLHADRLFLGCNGVHHLHGITNANHEEAEIKQLMVAQAREVVVVADYTKLGQVSRAQIAPLERVTCLITDKVTDKVTDKTSGPLSPELRAALPDIQFA